MPSRTRRLVLLALTTFVVLVAGAWALWPRTAITPENAAKIQEGMTLAQVEEILGGPERDDTTGPLECSMGFSVILGNRPQPLIWISDHITIQVVLGLDGRVEELDYCRVPRAQESPLDMLRRWLRL